MRSVAVGGRREKPALTGLNVSSQFFAGAWRDLRAGRPGMDVPVALAIGGAYAASLINSFRGVGEVYFDSVRSSPEI